MVITLETWAQIAGIVAVPLSVIGWFVGAGKRKLNKSAANRGSVANSGDVRVGRAAIVMGHNSFVDLTVNSPRIKWSAGKKRELRQHRRTLIASWYSMISDVSNDMKCSQEIGKPLNESQVHRLLEMHPAYGSFITASRNYNGAGIRGIKLRFSRSLLRRKLFAMNPFRRKQYSTREGRLLRSGTNLYEVLRRTMEEISKIEKWWGID